MAAAPAPGPSGAVPNGWTCVDNVGPSPYPTVTLSPSPAPGGDVAVPQPTTTPLWTRLGEDCAATSYLGPAPAATFTGSGSDSSSTAELHAFRGEFALAGGLLLFTVAAVLIAAWSRR